MDLYKIISIKQWEDSQKTAYLVLGPMDQEFIHLAEEGNYKRIGEKFFKGQEVIVLLIDSSKLEGRLVKEANPGGTNKYYHLYDGRIPIAAVKRTLHDKFS